MHTLTSAQEGRNFGLDVLRCLSITSVVLFHSSDMFYDPTIKNLLFCLGIFDGVTVFFVLSGFLIGSQLIRILSTGAGYTDIAGFLARRAMKTLPSYYIMLFVLSAWSFGYLQANQIHIHEYIFFIQNFNKSHPPFFTEAWSLSVEEWFYLIVPVALLLCTRIFRWNIHLAIINVSAVILLISHLSRVIYIYR